MSFPIYRTNNEARISNVLAWEQELQQSREPVTILAGDGADRALLLGQVLGKATKGTPVITPDGGNTGDGALGALTLGAKAMLGDYVATCIAAATNGGTFMVQDPDGRRLADAEVGVAYVSQDLNFTISDGAADWAVGDFITVSVPAGSGKVVAIDFAALDGTQDAYGVLAENATAPDGEDVVSSAIVRDALVITDGLVWPAGATTDQQNAALAQLAAAAKRIYTRDGTG
ncbi:MAG: head decoration protein [Kiloniellaceae bacterium]